MEIRIHPANKTCEYERSSVGLDSELDMLKTSYNRARRGHKEGGIKLKKGSCLKAL